MEQEKKDKIFLIEEIGSFLEEMSFQIDNLINLFENLKTLEKNEIKKNEAD